MLLVVVVGRDENDRHVRGPAAVADQGRGFEPVHARHVDVEQNDREIAFEHLFQCLLAGFGGEKPLPEILEDGLVDEKLVRAVIDDENVGPDVVLCPVLYAAGGRLEVPDAVDEHRRVRGRCRIHVGLPDQPSNRSPRRPSARHRPA